MTMFESFTSNLKEQLTPHANKLSQELKVFGDTLFDRLDKIIVNTDSPEFQERRVRRYLPLTANTPVNVDIPQAEDWTLDLVAIVPSGGATTLTVRQGGLLVYAQNYANPKTDYSVGAVIQGGTQISISATADAELSLVFKVRVPKPSRAANPAIGETQFVTDERTEGGPEVQRHIAPGVNDLSGGTALPIGTNNR